MCGRFFLARRALEIAQALGLPLSPRAESWRPRYNIAPTQDVLTVVAAPEAPAIIDARRWGLIPSWAKDPSIGNRMINARLETVASKPAFARPFRTSRCVILADGFFEWRREGERKTPILLRPSSPDEILGFAGMWARWKPGEGDEVLSCTIITRPAKGPAAEVHERMPAIIRRESWPQWLGADPADPRSLMKALDEAPIPNLKTVPIATTVNNPRNDVPEILIPTG
jgi:putative SOS response-associated peptidase YedK